MGRLTGVRSQLVAAPSAKLEPMRRSSARERGYTARWDRASQAFIRDNPICRGCRAIGSLTPATLTDHVIPHRGDARRFWDRAMWQSSCDWHHNVVKQILERRFDAGELGVDDLWLDSPAALAVAASAPR